mmetsp:Transcript_9700/g.16640  ORF Transcript_9700/g.16640 Transcript_9700/m.16640 type:complete len:482 (+) Transcript_9700:983-2428(+)
MIRSRASAISSLEISLRSRRAAMMAASFMRFSRSAPLKPGVRRATFSKSTSPPRVLPRECTCRILMRPCTSGRSTVTWRSKRPGRRSAWSSTSGLLVAASTITPVLPSKPSISVRSWLIVCSRSSFPPPIPAPRWRPTASISSMNTMQGAFAFAFSNRSRTREAPTPTKSSTNSDAAHEKKGTPASPATALAMSVFPVPGGPTSRQPLGILAPSLVYLSGFLRKSTTSWSSSFAPSTPATSSKRTPVSGTSWNFDLLLPKSMGPPWPPPPKPPPPPAPPWPPCARLKSRKSPPNASNGNSRLPNTDTALPCWSPSDTLISTPFLARMSTSSGSLGRVTTARRPSTAVSCSCAPSLENLTRSTLPFCTALMNSEYLHWLPSGSSVSTGASAAIWNSSIGAPMEELEKRASANRCSELKEIWAGGAATSGAANAMIPRRVVTRALRRVARAGRGSTPRTTGVMAKAVFELRVLICVVEAIMFS